MGGRSSSAQTTTQTSEQKDQRVGASDNAVAVGAGATIALTDPGAFNFAEEVIAQSLGASGAATIQASDVAKLATIFAGEVAGQSIEFATQARDASFALVQDNVTQVLDVAGQSEEANLVSKTLKIALPLGLVFLAMKAQ